MKKLNWLTALLGGTKETVIRFPWAAFMALVGTAMAITMYHWDEEIYWMVNFFMTVILGFFIFISQRLLMEQKAFDFINRMGVYALIGLFLVGYYFLLPEHSIAFETHFFSRTILWTLGFVLLIMFIPFILEQKKKDTQQLEKFWEYNRMLFGALLQSVFYAICLFVGIAIALSSIDFLFDIDIDGDRYFEVWAVSVGIVGALVFLSRIPQAPEKIVPEAEYPKEVAIFTQYILIPLVTLYFLILYAYTSKILITWEWPKGTVAYMILGFSLLGVFTHFFLYPLTQKKTWAKWFEKIFYVALIPQIFMLFWAIWIRIGEYGITEKRYLTVIFGAWLLLIGIYYLLSKKKDLRATVISLFVVTFLSSFGPWGAFSVSESSQTNRLEKLLIANNLLVDGKIKKASGEVSFEDRKEISATVRYLYQVHNLSTANKWFTEDLSTWESEVRSEKGDKKYSRWSYNFPEAVVEELIGIEYVNQWERSNIDDKNFSLWSELPPGIEVTGYDYFFPNLHAGSSTATQKTDEYIVQISSKEMTLAVKQGEKIIFEESFGSWVKDLVLNNTNDTFDPGTAVWMTENDTVSIKFHLTSLYGKKEGEEIELNSLGGGLLLKVK